MAAFNLIFPISITSRFRATKKTVNVAPGVKRGPLFQTLEKQGVMAVGGRDFNVGVPGFIFGGQLYSTPFLNITDI